MDDVARSPLGTPEPDRPASWGRVAWPRGSDVSGQDVFGGALVTHASASPTAWPTRRPAERRAVESREPWPFGGMGPFDSYGLALGPYSGLGPRNHRRSDARILEDVCDALLEDPFVDASDIEVRVEGGLVSLEGSVEDRAQKWRAEDASESVPGVVDVDNRLRVRSRRIAF